MKDEDGYDEDDEEEGLPLLPAIAARRREARTHLLNLAILSSGFFCIFFAFGTTQLLESSLIPGRLGYWCLASLYGTMCVSSLFLASPVAKALRERKALVLGAAAYVVFVAANLYPDWVTLIPASAVLGMGAGILWTAAGSYITAAGANYAEAKGKPPKSEMGLFNGIFAAARTWASVMGNVVASLIFIFGDRLGGEAKATKVLFYLFTAVGIAGVLVMLLLGDEKTFAAAAVVVEEKKSEDDTDDDAKAKAKTKRKSEDDLGEEKKVVFNMELVGKKARDLVALHRDPRLFLLIPLFFYSGYEQAFATGDFAKEVVKKHLDLSSIGFVFAWYCLVMTLCSALLGRLSDTVGRRLFLAVGVACHVPFYLFFGLLWPSEWVPEEVISQHPLSVYAAITLLSVGDSCFTTLPPILMSVFFTDNTEPAFANHKFYQSLGSVFGFILGPLITFPLKILLLSTGLFTATALMILLDRRFASIDKA
ncbi:transporter, major facilitator subfamily protein [Acanthamoeba castellanii str. Neff]|uniref:Transporter, major facilitator subfamily protein n=1 Tax=Acanthamoeba castellanii (strain ATCC 30010 / Neff) TaxID=1257118 RepID=L8GED9_ACACF|nr:transporter, major facilitator subfamily protein [Acanthamoeba castellanii str. Neff]ELR11219.1 transporter, major facilitator subfamily protein [Acanthamoeba castellanii str. Neff]